MRFLALKLINNDQTLIVKIGNILASSNNLARLFILIPPKIVVINVQIISSNFPKRNLLKFTRKNQPVIFLLQETMMLGKSKSIAHQKLQTK